MCCNGSFVPTGSEPLFNQAHATAIFPGGLTRTIHECRREAFEIEARRGFSPARPTQAYLQSVEGARRDD